jgi:hypothetical protein
VILDIALLFVHWFLTIVHDAIDGDVNVGHNQFFMQGIDGSFPRT